MKQINAKLIKYLENYGYGLDFPDYDRPENAIIEILKLNNERLSYAIPLLLNQDINYDHIYSKISNDEKNGLNKIIFIANKIEKENDLILIKNRDIIKKIPKISINKQTIDTYYHHIIDSFKRLKVIKEEEIKRDIDIISKFNTTDAMRKIFSDGKIRILNKIYNHEKLTKTELEYYYRSISPLCKAILNENLRKYCKIIETTKKNKTIESTFSNRDMS